ncbi:MAG: ABC transporter ATP-binding protein [Hyphomicrobiales bacterium]
MSLLQATDMRGGYGAADILKGCTITCDKGEVAVIVGPNGAGKSTAIKAIFGMMNLREGDVTFEGKSIKNLAPQERVEAGMGMVPQTNNVFPGMTVEENLQMGAFLRDDGGADVIDKVYELFPAVKDKRYQHAGELSGGQRQQVAVGRAMMTEPTLLILDEPTAGVSPIVMDELFDRILEIAKTGVAILMVEQNARQALEIADTGYVLVEGQNRFTDTGEALLADKEVRATFLGGDQS